MQSRYNLVVSVLWLKTIKEKNSRLKTLRHSYPIFDVHLILLCLIKDIFYVLEKLLTMSTASEKGYNLKIQEWEEASQEFDS